MRVVVVGAGLTGLLVARRLTASGVDAPVIESGDRWGGQIHTVEFAGRPIDVGAEAMHLGIPAVKKLVAELDLDERIIPANPGSSWLQTPKGVRPLPAGVGPTGPTRIKPVIDSGIMSLPGMARAGLEPVIAKARKHTDDISVGAFIRERFGNEVADLFVDPLLGNLHSGNIDELSLVSTAPQLVAKARSGTSLLPLPSTKKGQRPASPAAGAVSMFSSLPSGLHELTDALAAGLDIRLGARVSRLVPEGRGWLITTTEGQEHADGIVLAVPGPVAGHLLDAERPGIAADLAQTPTADVATVVLAYDSWRASEVLDQANGLLLPSRSGRLVKAMTNLSRKWPQVTHPDRHLVRVSVGRAGQHRLNELTDEQLVDVVVRELHEVGDLPDVIADARVHRWPEAMPQLVVGHGVRMARVRAALQGLPPVVLAGAHYDGLGIGSTVKSAEARSADMITMLEETP